MKPVRTGGFTLVEILITIAIIALIAAIAIPAFRKAHEEKRRRQAAAEAAVAATNAAVTSAEPETTETAR